MPSRKRLLYPKRKISRKIRGGSVTRMATSVVVHFAFTKYGLKHIMKLVCATTVPAIGIVACEVGSWTAWFISIFISSIFSKIYNFLVDKALSEKNVERVCKLIYNTLPASIFGYLLYTMENDFANNVRAGIKTDFDTLNTLGNNTIKQVKDIVNDVTSFVNRNPDLATDIAENANDMAANVIDPAAKQVALFDPQVGLDKMTTVVARPPLQPTLGPMFSQVPDNIQSFNPTQSLNPNYGIPKFENIDLKKYKELLDNPQTSINSVPPPTGPLLPTSFEKFKEFFTELLIDPNSSVGMTNTGKVVTVAMIAFAVYYIKTRLTASKEENEKLNKTLTEHERRRLLIYKYQQKAKQYEEAERAREEEEEEHEIKESLKEHFRNKTSASRNSMSEKKTPKNLRPKFVKQDLNQYRLRPTTPKKK
jgi:hypothetical protein